MKRKISENTTLEDGSKASTGHKSTLKDGNKSTLKGGNKSTLKDGNKSTLKTPKKIINVDKSVSKQIEIDRKVESYAYRIRQEVKKLSLLTDEISAAYSQYAESNERIDSSPSIHNGLGNMMKLIEVQTTTKLRIKKMQTAIMQAIAAETPDDELPYAIQDIMREVNINFLDSKLVRAYGEIARIMKEDLELAKVHGNEIQFKNCQLSSELESMPSVEFDNNNVDLNRDNVEEIENEA